MKKKAFFLQRKDDVPICAVRAHKKGFQFTNCCKLPKMLSNQALQPYSKLESDNYVMFPKTSLTIMLLASKKLFLNMDFLIFIPATVR